MKMLLSMVLLFFFVFSLFSMTTSCPENCFCEDFRAECHLQTCNDQLFTEVDVLVIYGTVCENHKYILTHIQSGTLIVLKDSTCGDIPNCRLFFIQFTTLLQHFCLVHEFYF